MRWQITLFAQCLSWVKLQIGWIVNKTVRNIDERYHQYTLYTGIIPSLVKSATHETLTVHYTRVNISAIVTRDVSIFVI